ncbi:hypothetical protein [Leuconostoc pseudomesenteroides]|uniref:hypothetical protein n=1 Tax=Leuconostoc pseudomesenteroides TaxID=33968 RepID=UPI0032DE5EA3
MVKATINNFESLALSGKTIGAISYATRKSVGRKSETDIAVVNLNDSLETFNIQPQSGFNFGTSMGTKLKLINSRLVATEVRSNNRISVAPGVQGELVPLSDTRVNEYDEDEYDMVYITGKNRKPVARVRSKDAFDVNDLVFFGSEVRYKTDNRNELVMENGEPAVSGYRLNFAQSKVQDDETGHLISIIISEDEYNRLAPTLKTQHKYVPKGLKIAFAGNETTNWTIYADTLVPVEADVKEQPKTSGNATKATSTNTSNNDEKGGKS